MTSLVSVLLLQLVRGEVVPVRTSVILCDKLKRMKRTNDVVILQFSSYNSSLLQEHQGARSDYLPTVPGPVILNFATSEFRCSTPLPQC